MANATQLLEDRAKVLIVEDEDALRASLAFRFEEEGFDVSEARDGVEALDSVRREMPHVILTDVRMPRKSGADFLKDLKESVKPEKMPVIFCLTGYSDLTEIDATKLWVDRYFHKPCDPGLLVAASIADLEKSLSKTTLRDKYLSFIREESQGFVLSAMTHEINNLLHVASLSTSSLKEKLANYIIDSLTTRNVARIEGSIKKMGGITKVIRSVSKQEAVPVQVSDTKSVLTILFEEARFRYQDLEIIDEVEDWNMKFEATPYVLHMVLINIIKNAYEAMSGKKTVKIGAKQVGETAVFSVTNPGQMPDEVSKRVFEPYFSTKKPGMGVGLAISKLLLEECRGSLELEVDEQSTTFIVKLPYASVS